MKVPTTDWSHDIKRVVTLVKIGENNGRSSSRNRNVSKTHSKPKIPDLAMSTTAEVAEDESEPEIKEEIEPTGPNARMKLEIERLVVKLQSAEKEITKL